jgi:hypothetical protein
MAVFSITINGPRRIEAINQARGVYNTERAANAAAQVPPVAFTPLTREQYLQMVIDSAVASWRVRYSDEIDAVLAAPEVAALAAAHAAVRTKAGAKDAA